MAEALEDPAFSRDWGWRTDEELDAEEPLPEPPLWKGDVDVLECERLVVALHLSACVAVEAKHGLQAAVPVATLGEHARVYRVDDGAVVVLNPRVVPSNASFAWARTLFAHVKCSGAVTLIDTIPVAQFGADAEPPALRYLATAAAAGAHTEDEDAKESDVCPALETASVLNGVTAALVAHCHVHGVAATLYVSLEDHHYLDATFLALLPVLGDDLDVGALLGRHAQLAADANNWLQDPTDPALQNRRPPPPTNVYC